MKLLIKLINYPRKYWKYSVLMIFVLLLTQCIDIDSVDQPATIQAGDVLTTTVHVHIKAAAAGTGARLVIGFLAPKKWNAASNTTMSYTSNYGDGTMSLAAAGSKPAGSNMDWPTTIRSKSGIGKNKIRDLEWVVFWSDKTYNIVNGDNVYAAVKIETKTGPQNVIVDLGYFAASTTEDINGSSNPYGVKFATLETTGGIEPVVNFLVPQLALVDPLQNLDNEFTTITFDGSLIPNNLTGASQVYLCATAYTNDHQTITVCDQKDKEKMTNLSRDKWRIDIWPRDYFNVSEGQSIDSMKYYFINEAGDVTVKQPTTDLPFKYVFTCQ